MKAILFLLPVALLLVTGCTRIERVDAKEIIDISGNWNDSDSQKVARGAIEDVLADKWMEAFSREKDRLPVVLMGGFSNNTAEHINPKTFTKALERALIKSSSVKVVAGASLRPLLRDEVAQMQGHVNGDTLKKLGKETGADYILLGELSDIVDRNKGTSVIYYQANFELIRLESHIKEWAGQVEIKKSIKKSKFF